ncbi:hypothetical protein METBIDRAFT_218813 [Metschnikowia bicuspidata var. bicuspidata NRRL YB-4993]|uniref:Uncharacterized protein n=1 Tax=Metschnikowia bicuspidata var. bicuspidata NRRL YB-4993 TaxID=869754 RepID=A0A1A0H6W6_9ASCO|nr:hypothetical protein METBIDRAFT_218813 [Metschnikowia bicuspidata var. bicuspidata NRRL YB-4993]OBA19695.1 hypothetical protein METBIDRAFT_218813 [Metschnikowia bicuspidata var. bicuspidata NRRL YB-4993]
MPPKRIPGILNVYCGNRLVRWSRARRWNERRTKLTSRWYITPPGALTCTEQVMSQPWFRATLTDFGLRLVFGFNALVHACPSMCSPFLVLFIFCTPAQPLAGCVRPVGPINFSFFRSAASPISFVCPRPSFLCAPSVLLSYGSIWLHPSHLLRTAL